MKSTVHQLERKDDKVSKIIDRVLNQIFGKQATQMIYRHLEHNYCLRRNEIDEKIEVFAKGLEDFLRSGAYAIERKILEDVYSSHESIRRLELDKTSYEDDFVSQMKLLMQKA